MIYKHICAALLFCCGQVFSAELKKFDWSEVLEIPPGSHLVDGCQIMHFKAANKSYKNNKEAVAFVEKYLGNAKALQSDAEVLRFGSDNVKISGAYIELGVCTGKTINFIAALNPHRKIYGFDSFQGLPEDWIRDDKTILKGTFGYKNPTILPPVLHNVAQIPGWFEETLPEFVHAVLKDQPIAFLHVDSDIYSAAATAFKVLGGNIKEGTIIVFDEFYNYPGSQEHEWKAFQEFLAANSFHVEYLAYNENHEQVAVRIKK